jgi:energy coupling factor transporter S component ThiW
MQNYRARKISLAAMFIAIGVILSPFTFFPVGPSLANPTQHAINVLSGILLGPLWGAFIALAIGLIRISLHVGTIFAIPGGIPGAIVIGILYHYVFKKHFRYKSAIAVAFSEPIGTVLIGATIGVYIIAPTLIGKPFALLIFYLGWLASSLIGATIGYSILRYLSHIGYDRKKIIGED